MNVERCTGERADSPFPIYDDLVPVLLAAHRSDDSDRNPTVAHVLGAAAGYAYADSATMSAMMSRLGLEQASCVRIAQTVDAMHIFATAYLVQSRCGRVVLLAYRGTEPTNLGNWITDADVEPTWLRLGGDGLNVHSGFHRNVRSTQWAVGRELQCALDGQCLADPGRSVDHPMEALYLTGHSLGGAMALLSALMLLGREAQLAIANTLRAVYTFGQPLAASPPLPDVAHVLSRKLFRHVIARDLVPALPPRSWGRFAHFGHEYQYADGVWEKSDVPVAQLEGIRDLPRSLLATFATVKARGRARYAMSEHGPHKYLAALRPKGRVSEFGDED